jgi:hypothetical protein
MVGHSTHHMPERPRGAGEVLSDTSHHYRLALLVFKYVTTLRKGKGNAQANAFLPSGSSRCPSHRSRYWWSLPGPRIRQQQPSAPNYSAVTPFIIAAASAVSWCRTLGRVGLAAGAGWIRTPMPQALLWAELRPGLAHYSAPQKAPVLERICSPGIRLWFALSGSLRSRRCVHRAGALRRRYPPRLALNRRASDHRAFATEGDTVLPT